MKIKTILLATAATLAITPAAHAYEGLYGAIGAGLTLLKDGDVSNDGPGGGGAVIFDSDADYGSGIGVYAALGYDWGNSWRTELEFSHRNNDINSIAAQPGFSGWPAGTISGDSTAVALMVNMLRDFDFGSRITPYIGGGIGVADVDHDIIGSNPAGVPVAPLTVAYGVHQRSFAYQGIAGLAVELSESLALDLSYRYFGTTKENFASTLSGLPASISPSYAAHNFFAGLRFNFGEAAPAAPQYKDCWDGSSVPMTSECPPQLVDGASADLDPLHIPIYFDYDKSNLTAQAAGLVQEAAAQALANDIDSVSVEGNADRSGNSAYNQALSQRRANVVTDALVANGVPADTITTTAYGEDNPAQPTADGVREPLNRRTDVTISFE